MHSVHSDGEWVPADLIRAAARAGLHTVALTDHDTTEGVAEMQIAGNAAGIEVLSGIEMSTWLDGDVHMLGYGFDPTEPALAEVLVLAREGRYDRAVRMTERLADLDAPVTIEQVMAQASGAAVGRPHVARALVAAGYCGSLREAFDRWLGDGKPACVDKFRVEPTEAVKLLHDAGGVAVAAHPAAAGVTKKLDALVAAGLDGVEVMHTLHGPDEVASFGAYADANGLVKTGGSDFHGPRGGAAVGMVAIPDEWVDALRDRIQLRTRAAAAGSRGEGGADG
jgi:predicted metal-dependent phosphoesterase TrpH